MSEDLQELRSIAVQILDATILGTREEQINRLVEWLDDVPRRRNLRFLPADAVEVHERVDLERSVIRYVARVAFAIAVEIPHEEFQLARDEIELASMAIRAKNQAVDSLLDEPKIQRAGELAFEVRYKSNRPKVTM